MRVSFCMTVSTLAAVVAFAQSEPTSPRFEAADVHPSPLTAVQARGPFMNGARYDFRNATMVDLIVKAYGVTADKVFDRPSWLEYNRFDISAAIPPKTSASDVKLMLQALLADSFQLTIRREQRSLPVYVLAAPKGRQKLKESDGSGITVQA